MIDFLNLANHHISLMMLLLLFHPTVMTQMRKNFTQSLFVVKNSISACCFRCVIIAGILNSITMGIDRKWEGEEKLSSPVPVLLHFSCSLHILFMNLFSWMVDRWSCFIKTMQLFLLLYHRNTYVISYISW